MIRIKRAYDRYDPDDGSRFLVDRIWPRGLRKEDLPLDGWLKAAAPSDALRRWFGHDPAKWDEFRERYHSELEDNGDEWRIILTAARLGTVTLLYGAHDREHNNAMALKEFLEKYLQGEQP